MQVHLSVEDFSNKHFCFTSYLLAYNVKEKTVENPQKGAYQRTTGWGKLVDEMNLTQATSSGSFNTNRIINKSSEFKGTA